MSTKEEHLEVLSYEMKACMHNLRKCTTFNDLPYAVRAGSKFQEARIFFGEYDSKWGKWVRKLGYSTSTAHKYMTLARQYPQLLEPQNKNLFNFINFAQASEIVYGTEEFRESIIQRLKNGEILPAKSIRILKRQYNQKQLILKPVIKNDNKENNVMLKTNKDDLSQITARITQLENELQQAREEQSITKEARNKKLEKQKNNLNEIHLAIIDFNETVNEKDYVGKIEMLNIINEVNQDVNLFLTKLLRILNQII
jgi:hypothetical protein